MSGPTEELKQKIYALLKQGSAGPRSVWVETREVAVWETEYNSGPIGYDKWQSDSKIVGYETEKEHRYDYTEVEQTRAELQTIGKPAVPLLLDLLTCDASTSPIPELGPRHIQFCSKVLSDIADYESVKSLIPYLETRIGKSDDLARRQASAIVDLLGSFSVLESLPILSSILQQPEERSCHEIKVHCVQALGKIATKESILVLFSYGIGLGDACDSIEDVEVDARNHRVPSPSEDKKGRSFAVFYELRNTKNRQALYDIYKTISDPTVKKIASYYLGIYRPLLWLKSSFKRLARYV